MAQKNSFYLNKILAYAVLIGVFLVIAAGVFYSTDYFRSNNLGNYGVGNVNYYKSDSEVVLREIIGQINSNDLFDYKFGSSKRGSWGLWWISDDGWNIFDKEAVSIDVTVPVEKRWIGNINATHPYARNIKQEVSKIFMAEGFELDSHNSSQEESDTKFYDYVVAFKKNEIRCALVTDNDVSVKDEREVFSIYISCSEKFRDKYTEQSPYLISLNNKEIVISDIKKIGDFVRLEVHARRSGYYIVGKIEKLKFAKIFEGQDAPLCSLVEEYNVPQEIYGECFREEPV